MHAKQTMTTISVQVCKGAKAWITINNSGRFLIQQKEYIYVTFHQ